MSKQSKQQRSASLSPGGTPKGTLPPFEVAKAYAFDVVIGAMEKKMGKSACVLLGGDKGEFIASQLRLQGGGRPSAQCVFQNIAKCKMSDWYPGKVHGQRTGRTPDISDRSKESIARVLMETKRKLERPTPQVARAKLPRLSINPSTGNPISDTTIYGIMHTLCYDATEDDPWVYAYSPSKDYLNDAMKAHRARTAQHI